MCCNCCVFWSMRKDFWHLDLVLLIPSPFRPQSFAFCKTQNYQQIGCENDILVLLLHSENDPGRLDWLFAVYLDTTCSFLHGLSFLNRPYSNVWLIWRHLSYSWCMLCGRPGMSSFRKKDHSGVQVLAHNMFCTESLQGERHCEHLRSRCCWWQCGTKAPGINCQLLWKAAVPMTSNTHNDDAEAKSQKGHPDQVGR